jgi:hypothetical protein
VLHLANEKGLFLQGKEDLSDFHIVKDGLQDPTFGAMPDDTVTATSVVEQRSRREKEVKKMGL